MTLKLYNTLTNSLETFQPLTTGQVLIYCCGITVYDYCHLGHARTCLVWDVVRHYLQWKGYQVRYVQNFTDIDDKILKRARTEGSTMEEIAERYIKAYFEDMDHLGIKRADSYPRATHTINGIKRLVWELEEKGYAYRAEGDVYYAVRKFSDYGKLSKRKLEDLQAGASGRVEEDPEAQKKLDPFDFALWKAAKVGEPAWESNWGLGRPGWHIECSAMVRQELGETIDIHVGGSDLIFPHHENEIAQSEAVTGKPLSHYWLHNGMVTVNGEKMSKSLGNFITIRELLEKYDPMAVRLFVLQAHYRKPIDFTDEALSGTTKGWQTLKEALLFGYEYGEKLGWSLDTPTGTNQYKEEFTELVDNDFNFTGGLSVIFELAKLLVKERNRVIHDQQMEADPQELELQWKTLLELTGVLGLKDPGYPQGVPLQGGSSLLSETQIEEFIQKRLEARKAKNYAEGDRIRDYLKSQGIVLVDQPGGVTKWHRGS